ncbi:MAG: type II toxin-antitoxin system VapC family toxin [Moorellales bacterium]
MIMVDTSAWYAICDRTDKNHPRASDFFARVAETEALATTDFILAETRALLNARLGRTAAITFWQTLREADVPVFCIRESDLEAAWRILQSFRDQTFSLTDCTTFAVMERLRLERVFTFDRHFAIYRYGPRRHQAFVCHP